MSKYRTQVPVLPDVAARILRGAHRDEKGCLISPLTPSLPRPAVQIKSATVLATRVVMAVALGRPIEAHEDVHHAKCRTIRCVEPAHLVVLTEAEHRAHHGAERRLEVCPRHGTPYERRDRWGRPHCRSCEAEASVRYRRNHPDDRRPALALTEEQRLRRNERIRLRRLTPEGGAKMRAWEKAARERKAARAAADSKGCPAT